jgi:hypothetical protein
LANAEPLASGTPLAAPVVVAEEEVIDDPELSNSKPIEQALPPPPGRLHVELRSRVGVDTRWENDREEIVEATQIAAFELEHPRSEDVSFAVGLRARHFVARRKSGTDLDPAERYQLDVVPTAAYVDATLADGLHTRIGYQVTPLGRFDVFTATNFLALQDLRSGPASMPGTTEIAQPALRADIDLGSSFTLTSIYVPFFQPDLVDAVGSDYALFAVAGAAPPLPTSSASCDPAPPPLSPAEQQYLETIGQRLQATVNSSQLAGATNAGLRALAPPPSLAEPQGAMRLTGRSSAGELSLTVGTALERLPALVLSRDLRNLFKDPCNSLYQAQIVASTDPFLRVVHPRFSVAALDGATDIGPVQIGVELAHMQNRTLYAGRVGELPEAGSADLAQLGLRAEFAESDFAASVEGFGLYALDEPGNPDQRWFFLEDGRWFRGISAAVRWTAGRIALELLGIAATGPTFLMTPRIEWEALKQFYLELGLLVIEGPEPPAFGDPEVSIGGIYDGVDQAFVGIRWLP